MKSVRTNIDYFNSNNNDSNRRKSNNNNNNNSLLHLVFITFKLLKLNVTFCLIVIGQGSIVADIMMVLRRLLKNTVKVIASVKYDRTTM